MATTTATSKSQAVAVAAWIPLIVAPALVIWLFPNHLPKWAYMWTLAYAIYCGCKWLTWRAHINTGCPPISVSRQLAYLLVWPGLNASSFLNSEFAGERPSQTEWFSAIFKTIAGILALLFIFPETSHFSTYARGWVAAICIVVALHFGLFHILSCLWRASGVTAPTLMNAPLISTSLTEFWGKRWNIAFRDITHKFLFRPLLRRTGPNGALILGFIMSGLVHDLVISVPAGGGYGQPTVYFIIQIIGISLQKSRYGAKLGLDRGILGWLTTVITLLAPAMLLFHEPFMAEVLVPFAIEISALIGA